MGMKKTYHILLEAFLMQACCSKEALLDISVQQFVFLDKTTHRNLFFDADAVYNKDSIFISYDKGITYEKVEPPVSPADSSIKIDFRFKDTCLIKLSDGDTDTFTLNYEDLSKKSAAGQCRLTSTVLKDIRYNANESVEANYSRSLTMYK